MPDLRLIRYSQYSVVLLCVAVPCALVFVAAFVSTVVRSVSLPVCPICRRPKVRPSHRSGWLDRRLGLLRLSPFRCQGCLKRFYAFGHRALRNPGMDAGAVRRTDRPVTSTSFRNPSF